MLFQNQGFPEESELVVCKITKVLPHSVFAELTEYSAKSGMIHISEIAPGRIRNIRDFVKEGKIVICKVLKVRKDSGQIDLSLRRVNDNQRRRKVNEMKLEQTSEKILEFVAKKLNLKFEELYLKIFEIVSKKYPDLHECFEQVVVGKQKLADLGIAEPLCTEITEVVKQRISPPEVEIKGKISISTYLPNGVDEIKKILAKIIAADKSITLTYLGGGSFKIGIISDDYKKAEKILEKALKPIEALDQKVFTSNFERHDEKK